ncbi:MAG TPA: hypothetical protein P5511_08570, partial [Candidatus Goldiibacteriota bacterium]|nr:hypothetical protein [Candidatus Goldiibacteriota bacterium]
YTVLLTMRDASGTTRTRTGTVRVCGEMTEAETAGVTLSAYGVPKPYFDYEASGSGRYDRPIPVTYTVTGYAVENWKRHDRINTVVRAEDDFCGCLPWQECVRAISTWTYTFNWDRKLVWMLPDGRVTTVNSSSVEGAVEFDNRVSFQTRIGGDSPQDEKCYARLHIIRKDGSNTIELNPNGIKEFNEGDRIDLYVYARTDCGRGYVYTRVDVNYPDNDDVSSFVFTKQAGSTAGGEVVYSHRDASSPFAVTITPSHVQYTPPGDPQYGVISMPFYNPECITASASPQNSMAPEYRSSEGIIKGIPSGWGGNIIPLGSRYFDPTDVICDTCAATGKEKNLGYQQGTITSFITNTINAHYSAVANEEFITEDGMIKELLVAGTDEKTFEFSAGQDTDVMVGMSQGINSSYINQISLVFEVYSGGSWQVFYPVRTHDNFYSFICERD